MADPTNALCTSARVKQLLGDTSDTYTTRVETVVGVVSDAVARYCGRTFIGGGEDTTEYIDVHNDQSFVYVDRKPIVSVTSLYEDPDRKYGSGTLLTEDDADTYGDFFVYTENAMIERIGCNWAKGGRVLKVTYTGGYDDTAAVVAALPALSEAVALLCVYHLKQSKDVGSFDRIGITSISHGGSSTTGYVQEWPLYLRRVLDPYMHKVGV